MLAVTASYLRKNLKYYLDQVINSFETIIVNRGADADDAVVIMSVREYNSLMETEHLLSSESNRKALEKSIAQLERGEVHSFTFEEIEHSVETQTPLIPRKDEI